MTYIKFNEGGIGAYAAPDRIQRYGSWIFGYNKEGNRDMLLADGWMEYNGTHPLDYLKLENGQIIELEIPVVKKTVFTKLQIRRCLRAHGYEDLLNNLLNNNPSFKSDWEDAQDIDLNDEMMRSAIQDGYIPQEIVDLIQTECEGA